MDRFECFCMVYYAIESYYNDGHKTEALQFVLSDLNPFIWVDRGSADPAYFTDFCKVITQEEIPIEGSYALARTYLETLDLYKEEALEAFDSLGEEEWIRGAKEYLSHPHK